jgi:transcription elongation factor GreA
MQLPYRKPGKYMVQKPDPQITEDKFFELQNKLEKLLKARLPASEEVARLALFGDFSENVEYQLAKGRLRGINQKILETEYSLKNAEIIKPNKNTNIVQIGHTVTIENNNKIKTYQILGSAETNPGTGTISHNSPLGSALVGSKVGDTVKVKLADKIVEYKILKIK